MGTFEKIFLDITRRKNGIKGFTEDEYQRKVERFCKTETGDLPDSVEELMHFFKDYYANSSEQSAKSRSKYDYIIASIFNNINNRTTIIESMIATTLVKPNKQYEILFSENIDRFQIIKVPTLMSNGWASALYGIEDIFEYELISDSTIQVKNRRGVGNAIVGGLLFGPIGAVAGAMTSGSTTKSKNKYAVRLALNDMDLASIEIPCDTRDIAYRLLGTFSVFERKTTEKKKEKE